MNSWYNLRIMSKRPGNSLDFFLSKQTRVENDLSSENELDESKTAVEALSECNRNLMPALFRILQIFATLPITTATSERSFSTLKRIKTYLRNTMGEERLTGLALIAIHERSIHLQTDEIITKLAEKNRKIDIIL